MLLGAVCLVIGAAGWASRATLDEIVVGGLRQRIALVPSWQPLVAFALLALVVAALLVPLMRMGGAARPVSPSVASVLPPAFALILLLLPYLPFVADWWPGWQILAGPLRAIVWAIVLTQLLWTLWPSLLSVSAWWLRRPRAHQAAALWLVAAVAMGASAKRLTHTVLFPSGDEPHYLVMAQSLWRDGDLAIENNHRRGDYKEYFGRDLEPHYLTRGADGEIYSVHPVGMPLLAVPAYALGGYDGVVALFVVMAATALVVAWWWVVGLSAAPGTSTVAWAAIALSAPFLVNAFTIYPEVPAALFVTLAVALTMRAQPDARSWHDVAVSLLAGTLPWLSTKYAPMSAAVLAVALGRRWWPLHASDARAGALPASLRLCAPYGLMLLGWFGFFRAYWGTPWPSAPYGTMTQTELDNTFFGVPGLLFDQEYGLLVYAPAYVLAGTGLWTMLRRPGPLRRVGLEVLLVFAALLGTVGAFRIWWGGSAAPGRPIVSGLAILMLPMTVQLGAAAAGSARRAAQHVLVWGGVALCALLVLAQNGLLLANDRDGTSTLLAWLSPRWPLWTTVPTFIAHEAPRALLDVAVWGAVALGGAWALTRARLTSRGTASVVAVAVIVGVSATAAALVRALPAATPALPGVDLRARARLAALDSFDRVTRPLAVRYTPFVVSGASDVAPWLAVGVTPGLRPEPQPMRVLHNGRFSLPAGRYRAVVDWATRDPLPARAGTSLGLQVGRIGAPLTTWTVSPTPGGRWQDEFWLPVDAAFVGLRGTPELERSIASIRFEPLELEDAGSRTTTPQVLAAARYGPFLVLFHDELMYPESAGFWTTGQRPARLTIACPGGCRDGVTLRVHSGKRPNHLRLSTHGWSHELDLFGETLVDVAVPPPAEGGVIELDTGTTTGFVPIEVDPAIRDRRYLGAWIQVALPAKDPS